MKALQALVLMSLMACGTEPTKTTAQPATDSSSDTGGNIVRGTDPAPVATIDYMKTDDTTYALAIDDIKNMPPCERANNKQLVYVKNLDKFYSCETDWVEIPVKGAAGSAGTVGAVGPKGDKGDPGEPVSANEWYDPIDGHKWLIGSPLSESLLVAYPPCAEDWRLPTLSEGRMAVLHGLALASQALSGPTKFWTSDTSQNSCTVYTFGCHAAVGSTGSDSYQPTDAGVACIQVPAAQGN